MTRDEQARQRLVEIALETVEEWQGYDEWERAWYRDEWRRSAGFKNPQHGHFCAAGLTDAMKQAGLRAPAPGTPARRGAIALLDWIAEQPGATANRVALGKTAAQRALDGAQPGDIIAWKQSPEPEDWLWVDGARHAFGTRSSSHSMCRKALRADAGSHPAQKRCPACVWETRKGHVAVIVATDSESVTTVGWNEGPSPGRVMLRRLWRDPERKCEVCAGVACHGVGVVEACPRCKETGRVRPSETVLARKQGLLYGIARPVAA